MGGYVAAILLIMSTTVSTAEYRVPPPRITRWVIDEIKRFERLSLVAYNDTAHHVAIGYGHQITGKPITRCTKAQAEKWLRQDIRRARRAVRRMIDAPLNEHQLDALTSFVYNIGPGRFYRSSVLRELNRGRYERAAVEMMRYVKSDGKISPGLVIRRQHEATKFLLEV